jgi:hypothetical protein
MTQPVLLTSEEAAELRNTTTRQIQRLAQAGLLPIHRTTRAGEGRGRAGTMLFKLSDVRRVPLTIQTFVTSR